MSVCVCVCVYVCACMSVCVVRVYVLDTGGHTQKAKPVGITAS